MNNLNINYKMNLRVELQRLRPNLSEGSLLTYVSILESLYKKVFDDDNFLLSNFNDNIQILNFLKEKHPSRRKTILAALVVLTNNENYKKAMNEDVLYYNNEISKQEKTDTQKKNWIDKDEITEIYNQLEQDANLLFSKHYKTNSDLQEIQNYIIVCLFGGMFIPPRRSLDYCELKIVNIENNKNYISGENFVFNTYKTASTYGRQELYIPIELMNILNRWILINPTEYLLFDVNLNKMNIVKLNKRMNNIFGKKVGCNNFRHAYLTDKYGETSREHNNLVNDMSLMGSSENMIQTYIKLN